MKMTDERLNVFSPDILVEERRCELGLECKNEQSS
jgi:hypothetical protein